MANSAPDYPVVSFFFAEIGHDCVARRKGGKKVLMMLMAKLMRCRGKEISETENSRGERNFRFPLFV